MKNRKHSFLFQLSKKTIHLFLPVMLTITSCTAVPQIEVTQTEVIPEVTHTIAATITPELPTEIASPTSVFSIVVDLNTYPQAETSFINPDSEYVVSGTDAKKLIESFGGEAVMDKMINMYIKELVRQGKSVENVTFDYSVFQKDGKVYWNVIVKDSTGEYLRIKFTKSEEADKYVHNFGLTAYFSNFTTEDDFFDFESLKNPTGYENYDQQYTWDASGWGVIGLYDKGGKMVAWFDADKGEAGEWAVTAQNAFVTSEATLPMETGQTVLDTEYNLGGLVEIDQEESEEFYELIAYAFWGGNINNFTDKLGIVDFISALEYMKNNILPVGFNYLEGGHLADSTVTKVSKKPIDIRNVYIQLVDYSHYISYDGYDASKLDTLYEREPKRSAVSAGFTLVDDLSGEFSTFTLAFVQKDASWGEYFGFPTSEGEFSQSQLDSLNKYVDFLVYVFRSMYKGDPTMIIKNYVGEYRGFEKLNKDKNFYNLIYYLCVIEEMDNLETLPSDFPKPVLEFKKNM